MSITKKWIKFIIDKLNNETKIKFEFIFDASMVFILTQLLITYFTTISSWPQNLIYSFVWTSLSLNDLAQTFDICSMHHFIFSSLTIISSTFTSSSFFNFYPLIAPQSTFCKFYLSSLTPSAFPPVPIIPLQLYFPILNPRQTLNSQTKSLKPTQHFYFTSDISKSIQDIFLSNINTTFPLIHQKKAGFPR